MNSFTPHKHQNVMCCTSRTACTLRISEVTYVSFGYVSCVRVRALFLEQRVGGAMFVDFGSSLDIVNEITFLGNSIQIEYYLGIWVRGWKRSVAVV